MNWIWIICLWSSLSLAIGNHFLSLAAKVARSVLDENINFGSLVMVVAGMLVLPYLVIGSLMDALFRGDQDDDRSDDQ